MNPLVPLLWLVLVVIFGYFVGRLIRRIKK